MLVERTVDGLAGLFAAAGLANVTSARVDWTFTIGADQLWSAAEAGIATVGKTYRAQSAEIQKRMHRAYSEPTAELSEDGLLHFSATAIMATGTTLPPS